VLLLSNSDEIENKLANGEGRIAQLIKEKKNDEEAIDVAVILISLVIIG
jgi:hypothetical protein